MESKDIAIKIYQMVREGNRDPGYALIFAHKMLVKSNVDEVLAWYKKLMKGEYEVATITTASETDDKTKQKYEGLIQKQFGERVLFDYCVDKNVVGGLLVKVGDRVLDNTLRRKILEAK